MKIFLISNMYPSEEQPGYGIFVKVIKERLTNHAEISIQALIKGRGKNLTQKIIKYIRFYTDIIIKGLFHDYDIIYTHYGTHSAIPLLILKFFIKKPLVINVHGFDLFVGNSKEAAESKNAHGFLYPFFKRLAKSASLFVVPSNYFKDIVAKEFKINQDKIFVSPSGGIDLNIFKKKLDSKIRQKYNISNDTFVISFVSRIVETKGWKVLVESIKELKNKNIDFVTFIVGSGPDEIKLIEYINIIDISDKIIKLPYTDKQNLIDIYSCSDIFIFPTFSESLGLVALESMACGTPVIGSNIPPLNEYIIHKENGLLFEVNNPKDLTEKIVEYINFEKQVKDDFIKNSLDKIKVYDSDKIIYSIFKKFKSLI